MIGEALNLEPSMGFTLNEAKQAVSAFLICILDHCMR